MNFLITGANFNNKGAQSMLFITMDEIKKRSKDAEIWFATIEDLDFQNYHFHTVYSNELAQRIALSEAASFLLQVKGQLKDCVKFVVGKRNNLWKTSNLKKLMPKIDVIIDVSGFALGKKWSAASQEKYLNNIRLAQKYHKPIYLMPQSFGGFHYPEETRYLLPEIKELLQYPRCIFAREEQGEQALKKFFHLTNVKRSYDLVLQNCGVLMTNVFKNPPKLSVPAISGEKNVALIPNQQCFRHGDPARILSFYSAAIMQLKQQGFTIYVCHHSGDDAECCRTIYENFASDSAVKLLEQDFSCFEYDAFIKQFSFIICSRYHGIVHAYRNTIPAIALGWEIKYLELAKAVGQESYSFDITNPNFNEELLGQAIIRMSEEYEIQRKRIAERLKAIQEHNCFDYIAEFKD